MDGCLYQAYFFQIYSSIHNLVDLYQQLWKFFPSPLTVIFTVPAHQRILASHLSFTREGSKSRKSTHLATSFIWTRRALNYLIIFTLESWLWKLEGFTMTVCCYFFVLCHWKWGCNSQGCTDVPFGTFIPCKSSLKVGQVLSSTFFNLGC